MALPKDQEKYMLALAAALKILPAHPPRIWTERTLAEARCLTEIILGRLRGIGGTDEA